MPQAIVDPAELRRFAGNLRNFCAELENQVTLLGGQFSSLGATWRDQEHQKFAEEFEQTMLAIRRFLAASSEHIPYLLRKSGYIEEYLQQR